MLRRRREKEKRKEGGERRTAAKVVEAEEMELYCEAEEQTEQQQG